MVFRVFALISTLGLAACADLKQFATLAIGSHADLVSVAKNPSFAPKVIQISLGKQKAVMIRAETTHNEVLWKGNNGESLTTRGGRLVGLVGTTPELRGYHSLATDPLVSGQFTTGARYMAESDYMPNYRYGVRSQSVFQLGGTARQKVLGVRKTLTKVLEQVTFSPQGKTVTNIHWVDSATGQVWKSKQYYSPYSKPVILERVFSASVAPVISEQAAKNWKPGL